MNHLGLNDHQGRKISKQVGSWRKYYIYIGEREREKGGIIKYQERKDKGNMANGGGGCVGDVQLVLLNIREG